MDIMVVACNGDLFMFCFKVYIIFLNKIVCHSVQLS